MSAEPLTIFECPVCGRVSDGEAASGRCAGAVYDDSIHATAEMVRVRVFREHDVRGWREAAEREAWLWDALPQPIRVWAEKLLGEAIGADVAREAILTMLVLRGPMWDDVRPLWEGLVALIHITSRNNLPKTSEFAAQALNDFPAPEEWTA
jgi:hypothetical protein